jgi:iron complex outermembrane receptor protein
MTPNSTDVALIAANLRSDNDVNTEKTVSARVAALWTPTDTFETTLTYIYQQKKVGGRQLTNRAAVGDLRGASDYISAYRVPEPSDRETQLVALEAIADFGWASRFHIIIGQ